MFLLLRSSAFSHYSHGVARYENGGVYVGEWAGDHRHGWGRHAFANGDAYEGEWADDKVTGEVLRAGARHQAWREQADATNVLAGMAGASVLAVQHH